MKNLGFLKAIGLTLVVGAILMHFCICEWGISEPDSQIIWFVHAREQFIEHDRLGNPTDKYNIFGAGFWGLVIPVFMAGSGIALFSRATTPKK